MNISNQEKRISAMSRAGQYTKNLSILALIASIICALSIFGLLAFYVALILLAVASMFVILLSPEYISLWSNSNNFANVTMAMLTATPFVAGAGVALCIATIILCKQNPADARNRSAITFSIVNIVLLSILTVLGILFVGM